MVKKIFITNNALLNFKFFKKKVSTAQENYNFFKI